MANPRVLLAEVDGHPVLGIGTAFGDGAYEGNDGFRYGVDAGLLGVVPVEVAQDNALYAMTKVVFDNPFSCRYEEDEGVVVLGHIEITTNPRNTEEW